MKQDKQEPNIYQPTINNSLRPQKTQQIGKKSRSPSFSQTHANEFSFDNQKASQNQQDIHLNQQTQEVDGRRSVRFLEENIKINQLHEQQNNGNKLFQAQNSQSKQLSGSRSNSPQKQSLLMSKERNIGSRNGQSLSIREQFMISDDDLKNRELIPVKNAVFRENKSDQQELIDNKKNQIYSSQKNLSNKKNKKSYIRETESSAKKRQNSQHANDPLSLSMFDQNLDNSLNKSHRRDNSNNPHQQDQHNSLGSQFTFKPKLNEISELIAKKKKQLIRQELKDINNQNGPRSARSSNPKNHFEILYKMDTERKKQMEQKMQEQNLLNEMSELQQCTFKPDIYQSRQNSKNLHNNFHHHTQRSGSNFYERNLQWLDQKETKLKVERKKDKKDIVKECTFKPDIKQSDFSYQHVQKTQGAHVIISNKSNNSNQIGHTQIQKTSEKIRGVDIFIKRLHEAQQKKIEEVEVFLLPSQKRQKKQQLLNKNLFNGQQSKMLKEEPSTMGLWKNINTESDSKQSSRQGYEQTPNQYHYNDQDVESFGIRTNNQSSNSKQPQQKTNSHHKKPNNNIYKFDEAMGMLKSELRAIDFNSSNPIANSSNNLQNTDEDSNEYQHHNYGVDNDEQVDANDNDDSDDLSSNYSEEQEDQDSAANNGGDFNQQNHDEQMYYGDDQQHNHDYNNFYDDNADITDYHQQQQQFQNDSDYY
eukprot:403348874